MKSKYDYNSPEFLNRVEELAKQRLSNQEIANHLDITIETFRNYAKKNPYIGQALAYTRFRINKPLCDIDIPDVELLSWMLDLCVSRSKNAKCFGLTKRRVALWAKRNRAIRRFLNTSKSWAKLRERKRDDKWI